jgi:hypothetical protein
MIRYIAILKVAYIYELQASVGRPETDRQIDKKQKLKT